METKQFERFFMEPTEKYITSIGSSYLQDYIINGTLSKGIVLVSNKRVYFKGECFYEVGKKMFKQNEERVVDLKDVTGTGFTTRKVTWILNLALSLIAYWLVTFIIGMSGLGDGLGAILNFIGYSSAIGLIASIYLLIAYLMKKNSMFEISYSGGKILFNMAWYDQEEFTDFQRQIRLAKDNILLSINKDIVIEEKVNAETASFYRNTSDEIREYAKLFQEGLITQEEFEKAKLNLLSK